VAGFNPIRDTFYRFDECESFRKTKQRNGDFSNMAGGYVLMIFEYLVRTAEALYQACRFPHRPDIQHLIIQQPSPMGAKMKAKLHRAETRADWLETRVVIMEWVVGVKLAKHWAKFGGLLMATGNRPIVEDSTRDDFWGAIHQSNGTLTGRNEPGLILMRLRDELRKDKKDALRVVTVPPIPDFRFMGTLIGPIGGDDCTPSV
jgi:ribA/ribD-fused uncharacterized protein